MQVLELAFSIEELFLKSTITCINAYFIRKQRAKINCIQSRKNAQTEEMQLSLETCLN